MKFLVKPVLLLFVLMLAFTACGNQTEPESPYSDEQEDIMQGVDWTMYDEEYLEKLRTKYNLDELVANCDTDMEKTIVISTWVSGLWEHDGYNAPQQTDPIYILDQVTENGENFRCQEYGIVIDGCLKAVGIQARTIGLKTADVETREFGAGHVVTEAYLTDYEKWVFIDGQCGVIPTLGDVPLNAVEFAQAINTGDKDLNLIRLLDTGISDKDSCALVAEYIYYLDVTFKKDDIWQHIMLVPTDAPNPTIFQNTHVLDIDTYTNSKAGFYPDI